jgi:hypothetical protein
LGATCLVSLCLGKNEELPDESLLMHEGTMVDATVINAPCLSKNAAKLEIARKI